MTITRAGKAGVAGGSVSDLDGLKAPKGSNLAAPDSHICPKCGSEMAIEDFAFMPPTGKHWYCKKCGHEEKITEGRHGHS